MIRFVAPIAIALLALAGGGPAWSDGPKPGLVAAYSFDEGSGALVNDATGNGHIGTVSGATWAPGRYGNALSFNGNDASVLLGSLGTFYNTGFTLEAWVRKQTTKNDVAVVGTWTSGGGPMIWVDHIATRYHLALGNSLSGYLDSGRNPAVGEWQHLAATSDGATARFYIDGTEVASRQVSGAIGSSNTWRIGAYNSVPGGFFDGLIDEVRIYDRSLSAGEITGDMNEPINLANPGAPTEPTNFAVTARTQTSISVQWSPATDDVGVSGYRLYRDGIEVATTAETSFTFTGLACSTTYQLEAEAFDGDANVSTRAVQSASTELCDAPTGLVAAYAFDEGAGGTLFDASGNGHPGTISGATWAGGHTGGALSFDGTSASVDLGALGPFYQSGFTLEAWVRKQTTKNDVAVLGTWTPGGGGPMLWVDHIASHYNLTLGTSLSGYLDSGRIPVPGQWQHLAATFDGSTARFYIDGAQVASRSVAGSVGSSNSWRIGAYGSSAGGFFDGLIDDVRIYNRALPVGAIETDMSHPVTFSGPPPDVTPPTPPGTLTATGGIGRVTLGWGAATDNVGVTGYEVYRSSTAGFTPSTANRVAQPSGTSYVDLGLAAGTYYYKVKAADAASNLGPASNEASATATADTTRPVVAITAPAAGATVSGATGISAGATDNQAVAGVQFTVDGKNLGAEDTMSPYSVPWDTRGELNGQHSLRAVARDVSGNTATSAAVAVTVSNSGVSATGLQVAYGLDDGSGSIARDSSGNNKTGTLVGAGWTTTGRFGGAVSLSGAASELDPLPLGTFYKTSFTYEAWVLKQSAKADVAVLGSWTSSGGPMIWVDHVTGRYRLTLGNAFGNYLDSGRTPTVGQWQHVAATYDGAVARIYIDGGLAASTSFPGNVGDSNTWRIGAYGAPAGGFFDGLVDNVRIYDRALTASEIEVDMASRIQPETIPPTVTSQTPVSGETGVNVGTDATATFSEPMTAGTIKSSTFLLKDASNASVPASVTYNSTTNTARLAPQSPLEHGASYTLTVKSGSTGVKDLAGNPLASDVTWSFSTDSSTPILLVTSSANPFSSYLAEILRGEGLNNFSTIDVSFVTEGFLSRFDVVVLGDVALNTARVTALTNWVNGGGNLIAMHPDTKLAGLLGLTKASGTWSNAYLKVATGGAPGAGIVGSTIQFHGTADRYSLSGATAVATLYSNATTATTNPAVSLRSVGSSGGQAAAFTYDLARSVVYTRQGNPAWAGQDRDGVGDIRPNDLFYGAAAGDSQPNWVNLSKLGIPQADEQQRLLANLVLVMNRDRTPVPRFWYLPREEKAAIVMTGDDHGTGGTAGRFDAYLAASPPGCSVADWECVRSTSYIYTQTPLSNAQAGSYTGQGFEVGLHPSIDNSCKPWPQGGLDTLYYTPQLNAFAAKYTSVPAPVTSRTHCVEWADWATQPKVELAHGIRLDTNYYHYPGSWIGTTPGYLTGSALPMRFADLDGSLIDVYQAHTHMTDESSMPQPASVNFLLDKALGAEGYYGFFTSLNHTDLAADANSEAIINAAQTRGVPVISAKQALAWVDGRNNSKFRDFDWNGSTLTFTISAATGSNGLRAMLPTTTNTRTLTAISRNGSPLPYTTQTIKGITYALFTATTGTYTAEYSLGSATQTLGEVRKAGKTSRTGG